MGIKILLEEGPKPRKGVGGIVLANMEDVGRARDLGWGWKDIAKELGVESPQAVRKAYLRIKKRVESGRLTISGPEPTPPKRRKDATPEKKKCPPVPGGAPKDPEVKYRSSFNIDEID